jgi:phosphoribosylformimino-5-aminoimidazole carboxamide ribotide isomerase
MLLYPAIDLMSGQAVRLQQGKAECKTIYSDDPPEVARQWESRGGDWLHVVDLDAAFSGVQSNLEVVQRITETIKIPLQLGGGMRSEAAIEQALLAGAARVVIGTRAAESLDFVADAVLRFGGEKLAVGIDARDGLVAVRGWTEATSLQAEDLAKQVAALGVAAVIYTDIATDGMLQGPNVLAMEKLVAGTDCAVIASGGVSSAEDLVRLEKIDNLSGTIIGKALFDGLIAGNLREAMAGNSK